jgi:hypothetical protein
MKRNYFLILILANFLFLEAQFIDNKFNIGFGISACSPLNPKNVSNDQFVYPSLYGNYPVGISGILTVKYQLKPDWNIIFDISKTLFADWNGDKAIFILHNPSLKLSTVSIVGLYLPDRFLIKSIPVRWGVLAGPVLSKQKLSWTQIDQYTDNEITFPEEEKKTLGGFKAGIVLLYLENDLIEVYSEVYYQYLHCYSNFYNDKAFHSVNFSLQLNLKLFKNRYYNYE